MAKLTNTMSEVHGHITIEPGWKDDVWTLQQWNSNDTCMFDRAVTITTSELRHALAVAEDADQQDGPFDVVATIDPEMED